MIQMKMIVAHSANGVIGVNNKLPWHIPSDLKRFKKITENNVVVMGRGTYESLPVKPLPNRINIVLTTKENYDPGDESVVVLHSIDQLLSHLESPVFKDKVIYVIGGEVIYKQLLPYTDTIYATVIENEVKGDAFFPLLNTRIWKECNRTTNEPENGLRFDYVEYRRF